MENKKKIKNYKSLSGIQKPTTYYLQPTTLKSKDKGFTLVEVLVAFSIFLIVTGLVLASVFRGFQSFGQGQRIAQREQRKRFVFFRLGKELSSLTRIIYPGSYFKGDNDSFFLSITRRMAW